MEPVGLGWRNFKTRQYSGGIGITAHCSYPVCSDRASGETGGPGTAVWQEEEPEWTASCRYAAVIVNRWAPLHQGHREGVPRARPHAAKSSICNSGNIWKGMPLKGFPAPAPRKVFSQIEPPRYTEDTIVTREMARWHPKLAAKKKKNGWHWCWFCREVKCKGGGCMKAVPRKSLEPGRQCGNGLESPQGSPKKP